MNLNVNMLKNLMCYLGVGHWESTDVIGKNETLIEVVWLNELKILYREKPFALSFFFKKKEKKRKKGRERKINKTNNNNGKTNIRTHACRRDTTCFFFSL